MHQQAAQPLQHLLLLQRHAHQLLLLQAVVVGQDLERAQAAASRLSQALILLGHLKSQATPAADQLPRFPSPRGGRLELQPALAHLWLLAAHLLVQAMKVERLLLLQ